MKRSFLKLSLVVMSFGTAAQAAEYFVAPGGCDAADGSSVKPWRTIQRAADVAVAGDVVTIRGGVYREWVKPANAGREDAPITYRAAKGEKVVVTGADPVTGWTRRPDGLWTARVCYDTFGGMNPFTDFIYGDWFHDHGAKHFRTRLIQDGKPLELHTRDWMLGRGDSSGRFLVNIAGLTSGARTVPGDAAVSVSKGVKPGFDTKWGRELGWITDGATCLYRGFDFSTPVGRRMEIHLSSATYKTEIEICDAALPDRVLASVRPPVTGDWKKYTTVGVTLPDGAADVKDVVLRFVDLGLKAEPLEKGHAVLVPGMVSGMIIASFEKDPNAALPELTVRPACFYPEKPHRDYITLRGIAFRNAAPNWAPPTSEQTAVVGTNWSRGWVIEDCEVSGSECSGITLGKYGDEYDNIGTSLTGFFTYYTTISNAAKGGLDKVGHHLVRRCRITDCGQAGICGSLGAVFSTIDGCDISYCHWNKKFGGFEQGGIKIHGAVDLTVSGCRIHHCNGGGGIWFDWMGQGARVVGNTLWANCWDLFFEVDHGPILVEGNDLYSGVSAMIWSQSVAFVGNRMRGEFRFRNEKRRTPIFKPHSVTLDSIDKVECSNGGHVFVNNILAVDPRWAEEIHPSRYEDNWVIPSANWSFDETAGTCNITPSAGSKRPDFRPVDVKRLGKAVFVDQEFPAPSRLPFPPLVR